MKLILQAIKSLFRKVENSIQQTATALGKRIDETKDSFPKKLTELENDLYSAENKIPNECVDVDLTPLEEKITTAQTTANNAQTAANNAQTTADSKMNATDPVGTGSFSMNRHSIAPIGKNSFVTGTSNIAMHLSETVFGQYNVHDPTIDDMTWEKSEQKNTYVPSANYTKVTYVTSLDDVIYDAGRGMCSLKNASTASAIDLPTDVYILYPGVGEGIYTSEKPKLITTNQKYSSSSRRLWYYLYEPVVTVGENAGAYLHSIGNGTSHSKRSNAHTLDWNGVPWYQGRPQFGGNAQDDGSQTVMANGDMEIILASSTADSTKKFKLTVDDSGTITATEVT